MNDRDAVRRFFRTHGATAVGPTQPQPLLPPTGQEDEPEAIELGSECDPTAWQALTVPEAPARPGEFPERFIDGSHVGHPVLCLRTPAGWPIPLLLSEVGAVAMRSVGRKFKREFVIVERVLSFVADPFPWEEVEAFASALVNTPELTLRLLPANVPDLTTHSPFDYEVMRSQAHNRCQQEMLNLEVFALMTEPDVPTLVDGLLGARIGEMAAAKRPLLVGVVKSPNPRHLHPRGWQTLLDLRPGQRTPYFKYTGMGGGRLSDMPLASWFLKLAGGPRLAPNWGYVRVDVPWVHLMRPKESDRSAFVNRLSRWLMDARCRAESYARMPVSLEPIVRAEEGLKPLLTPFPVLANRLYRTAGLFRGNDL